MTRVALIAALILATQTQASTLDYLHTGDPEPLHISYVDGRISFAKDGDYVGGGKGCKRVWAGKDMRFDRVDYVDDCKPRFGEVRIASDLSAAAWKSADTHSLGAALVELAPDVLPSTASPRNWHQSWISDQPALNPCRCSSVVEQWSPKPRVGGSIPPTFANPSPVPLPAAGLMLIAAIGGLAALRRKRT